MVHLKNMNVLDGLQGERSKRTSFWLNYTFANPCGFNGFTVEFTDAMQIKVSRRPNKHIVKFLSQMNNCRYLKKCKRYDRSNLLI